MLLRSQFKRSDGKKSALLKATVVTVVVGGTLIALDASAAADKVDMLTGGLATLPSETLKVYTGLLKIVPAAAGAAAFLAAMRGGMGYVMGLVRSVIR